MINLDSKLLQIIKLNKNFKKIKQMNLLNNNNRYKYKNFKKIEIDEFNY